MRHFDFRLTATDTVPYPYALLLPQSITEQILTELLTARGGVVERALALEYLRQDLEGVLATITDIRIGAREKIHARWLISLPDPKSVRAGIPPHSIQLMGRSSFNRSVRWRCFRQEGVTRCSCICSTATASISARA
jgi:hypothetical protein